MDSRRAMTEFAELLSVGSAALRNVLDESGRAADDDAARQLLSEVDTLASRLREIGATLATHLR